MVIVDEQMNAVVRIDLQELGGGWRPIFYRIRATDVTSTGKGSGVIEDVGTVFGRARSDNEKMHVQLWAIKNGEVGDCPAGWIRDGAIRHLMGE